MVWKVEICVVQLLHRAYHILGNTIGLKLVILLLYILLGQIAPLHVEDWIKTRWSRPLTIIQTYKCVRRDIILSQPHLLLLVSVCLLSLLIVWRWSWMPREFYCVFLACIYSTNAKKNSKNWGDNALRCLQQKILTSVKSDDFGHTRMILSLPCTEHSSFIRNSWKNQDSMFT